MDETPQPTSVPLFVYKQLAEELDHLRHEIRSLRAENQRLEAEIQQLKHPKPRWWDRWGSWFH